MHAKAGATSRCESLAESVVAGDVVVDIVAGKEGDVGCVAVAPFIGTTDLLLLLL
jgi:hypothetical protein